jgi:threonylcarbamoyladenosine tRNA methylthiotransferase MtaB
MQKVFFKTFGCRTNLFDTQVMMANMKAYQTTQNELEADVIVINSCTVTNGADSGVRQYASQIKRKNPNAKILITGCSVETEGKKLFDGGAVFGAFGHSEKEKIDNILNKNAKFYDIGDKEHIDTTVVEEFVGHTKAFIKIQEGCDFECSYCIIPFVRGHSRSIAEETILSQITLLCDKGFSEFVLTGTNVGSFRGGGDITKLIRKISDIKGVKRIRLGSVEPSQIDEPFLEMASEPFFAKHLHIAIQHSHDAMLEAMKRHNRFGDDLKLFERLSEKGFAIGTDYIVGFPGEDDHIWQEAFANLAKMPLTHIHPFIYSPRDGTPASKMKPTAKGDESKARLHALNELVKAKNLAFRRALTSPLTALVEGTNTGFDEYYNKVAFETTEILTHKWVEVTDYEVKGDKTIAKKWRVL